MINRDIYFLMHFSIFGFGVPPVYTFGSTPILSRSGTTEKVVITAPILPTTGIYQYIDHYRAITPEI